MRRRGATPTLAVRAAVSLAEGRVPHPLLAMVSALPVIGLQDVVLVGQWMGLLLATALPRCDLGNMVPIVPLLFLLPH